MLNGKTALITGGNSGIGLATAKRLRAEGARVAITGTDAGKLEAARQETGGDALAIRADVRSLADLKTMAEAVHTTFGKLDILFANAGIAYGTPIGTTDEESFDRLMDINVKGVFFTVQSVLPIMSDGGSIILNTSWLGQAKSDFGPFTALVFRAAAGNEPSRQMLRCQLRHVMSRRS